VFRYCGGAHASYSRECGGWKEEKKVQQYKAEHNVSYLEAKKQTRKPVGPPVSYAEKTKIKQRSICIQTDAPMEQSESEKAFENRVNAVVSKVLDNVLANLVRWCGDALPAEIKADPKRLLLPPSSEPTQANVTPSTRKKPFAEVKEATKNLPSLLPSESTKANVTSDTQKNLPSDSPLPPAPSGMGRSKPINQPPLRINRSNRTSQGRGSDETIPSFEPMEVIPTIDDTGQEREPKQARLSKGT
jgi:hypothetical protein